MQKEYLRSIAYGCPYPEHITHVNPLADPPEGPDYKTTPENGQSNAVGSSSYY